MKIKGQAFSRNWDVLPILRGQDTTYIKVWAIEDPAEFDTLCPPPAPQRMKTLPGGIKKPDERDTTYLEALNERGTKKLAYMIIRSLEATPDLAWENVRLEDHTTWTKVEDELKEAGLTRGEIAALVSLVLQVNGMNEDRVNEARESFFLEQQAASE